MGGQATLLEYLAQRRLGRLVGFPCYVVSVFSIPNNEDTFLRYYMLELTSGRYRMMLPRVARYTVGVVAVGTRRYIDWLDVLHRYLEWF